MIRLFVLSLIVVMVSCSNKSDDSLVIHSFHFQTLKPAPDELEMAKAERLYRLHGAISGAERRDRLGYYYTVEWKNNPVGQGDLSVVLEYQQASTASKVLERRMDLPDDQSSGKVEFKLTGEEYRTGGEILSWRIRLMLDQEVVSEQRSYLWR